MRSLLISACCIFFCGGASANTPVIWVGGASGDFFTAANWDPQVVPSDESKTSYVAVFTNSVTTTGTTKWWYPGGVRVENASTVSLSFSGQRIMPTTKAVDNRIGFDVESGSSLSVSANLVYGRGNCTFEKTGGGTCVFAGDLTVGNADKFYRNVVVSEGSLEAGTMHVTNVVSVTGTATLKVRNGNGIQGFGSELPSLAVESGAAVTFDNFDQHLAALSGAGTVSGMKSMNLNLQRSGLTFSGSFVGKLNVTPVAGITPENATWIVGARDTLAEADFNVTAVEGTSAKVLFAPDIGIFTVKTYPAGTFYDTDGLPVALCSQALYVDAARPDDSGDGKSWATAFKTLKAALTPAPKEYAKVFVKPGRYDSGEMDPVSGEQTSNRVVVAKNVAVVSTGSATNTFIVGAASTDVPAATCDGCGPRAVRCAYLMSGASLRGFTLTGGHTCAKSASAGDVGGGVIAATTNGCLYGCVVSNNVAYRGNAVRCSLVRCRVLDNRAFSGLGGGILYGCLAYDTLFDGNGGSAAHYIADNEATFVNCTFGPNETANLRGGTTKFMSAYNTLFLSPIYGAEDCVKLHHSLALAGSQTSVVADGHSLVTNIADAAERLAYAGLDAKLNLLAYPGACLDAGDKTLHVLPSGEDDTLDLDGNARIRNGEIDLGALEFDTTLTRVALAADLGEGCVVTGLTAGATVCLHPGETLTYTLNRVFAGPKLCKGFEINGVFHDFDDYPNGWRETVTGTDYQSSRSVTPVYAAQNDWFVDPEKGQDANAGYHRDCPRKTVSTTLALASSGETVYAFPGVYANEAVASAKKSAELARVRVPAGVTFASLSGVADTFIIGAAAATGTMGCGEGAVRCVSLEKNATIRGFTLTGGHTVAAGNGGGVDADGDASLVVGCVISNNVANRGSAGCQGTYVGCRIVDNPTTSMSGALYTKCNATDCVFDGNGGAYSCYIAGNAGVFRNCTFGPNESGNLRPTDPAKPVVVYDSVFLSPVYADADCLCLSNCLVLAGVRNAVLADGATLVTNIADKVERLAYAGLDEDLRPLAGSRLIDAGLANHRASPEESVADAFGSQRVYNRYADLGGAEYDWRGDFAKCLTSSSRFAVRMATANVTTNAAGGLLLSDGDALTASWTNVHGLPRSYAFVASVSGAGTLTCVYGDVTRTVTAADGVVTLAWEDDHADAGVEFSFAGEGSAVLSSTGSKGTRGLVLIVK